MADIRVSTAQMRRILSDPRCTGSLESQNEHLRHISASLRDPGHIQQDRDTFEGLARRIDRAVTITDTWAMQWLIRLTDIITNISQALLQAVDRRTTLVPRDRVGMAPMAVNPTYLALAIALTLSAPVLGCIANRFIARREAKRLRAELDMHDKVLAPLMIPFHAMMVQFAREPAGTWTVSLYNAGGGLENHMATRAADVPAAIGDTAHPGRKFPTAFHVTGVSDRALTPAKLKQICGIPMYRSPITCLRGILAARGLDWRFFRGEARFIYWQWAASMGRVVQGTTQQTKQRSGNCTYKSTLAFMRNNTLDAPYKRFRHRFLQGVRQGWSRGSSRHEHRAYTQLLDAKIARARARAARLR